jgi:hypothetical protein
LRSAANGAIVVDRPRDILALVLAHALHVTFTEAALRARKAHLARSLVAERSAPKPASRFNRLLQRRLEHALL